MFSANDEVADQLVGLFLHSSAAGLVLHTFCEDDIQEAALNFYIHQLYSFLDIIMFKRSLTIYKYFSN